MGQSNAQASSPALTVNDPTGLVARIRNRIHDAPIPSERLLDEAADYIEALIMERDGWRAEHGKLLDDIYEPLQERDALANAVQQARNDIEEIKTATVEGRVCDDVAWFDDITTLHDFCEQSLHHIADLARTER